MLNTNNNQVLESTTNVYVKVKQSIIVTNEIIQQISKVLSNNNQELKVTARYPKTFITWLNNQQLEKARNELSSIIESIERVPYEHRITFSKLDMNSLLYSNLRIVMKSQEDDSTTSNKRDATTTSSLKSILNIKEEFTLTLQQNIENVKSSTKKRNSQWLKRELENAFTIQVEEEENDVYIIALQNFNVNIWPLLKQEKENQLQVQSSARTNIVNMLNRRRSLEEYSQHYELKEYDDLSQQLGELLLNSLFKENVESISRQFPQELLTFGSNIVIQNGGQSNSGNSGNSNNRFIWDQGITGQNQVIQIIDSGVEVNHCHFFKENENYFTTPNYSNRKIIFYQPVTLWGDKLDNNGHGSHCASIAAGNIDSNDETNPMKQDTGVAPQAKIYVTDVMRSIFFYVSSLNSYLTTAYSRQARISSNSWGCANPFTCYYDCDCYEYETGKPINDTTCLAQYGVKCCQVCNSYDKDASTSDSFTRANDEMLIVFAAGNNGHFSSEGGTILTPSTSKNALTVGAQYAHLQEYTRFNTTPIDEVLFNHENMAYFSARGNTADGRSKPDVVGPGVLIWAAYNKNVTQCTPSVTLTQKSGTSMATPSIAGSAALVRDYLTQNIGLLSIYDKNPQQSISGSLVKAMIIHSAQKMNGFVPMNGVNTAEIPSILQPLSNLPFPNKFNGYGSVNLKNSLLFSNVEESKSLIGSKLFIINRYSLSPNQELNIPFYISNRKSKIPIKVTLTWYDYAGTITDPSTVTMKQLINDIDLYLIKSNSNEIINSNPGVERSTQDDSINTVEKIIISPEQLLQSTTTTTTTTTGGDKRQFTLRIVAKSTNIGSQNFSLVVSGDIEQGLAPSPLLGYKIISKGSILSQNAQSSSLLIPGSIATDRPFQVQQLQPTSNYVLNINNDESQYIIENALNKYDQLQSLQCTVNNMDQNIPASGFVFNSNNVYCFPQGLNGNTKITFSGSDGPIVLKLASNLNSNFITFEFINGATYDNVYWLINNSIAVNGPIYGNILTKGVVNFNVVNLYGSIYNLGGNTLNLNQCNFY
ncbi:predicted protein [Naegleria gruberi]|uniref:Predicted protein n=1 Tax=Naegleria gruberi TaxID=5762 RepID=D2W4J4_NAEGR|nr:uncharacterized protein NAEGRDRAFT_76328 [Naegleria gruberi]EFC36008.1 predicted protein [Naegleria gruberi]|eukprot:XP_002668752.1 predicted protein [Naegleria gruberi strain NEG-M]